MNNDDFTVLVSGGGRCHWVSMCIVWPLHSKWLNGYSNESISHIVLSLNFPLQNYLDDSEGRSYGQLVIGSFITTMHPLMHHVSWRVFWQNIKSLRWLSSLQPRFGDRAIPGFSPNYNHLWKGRDFRLLMRFRKIQWGSWWRLGELCGCLLWRGLRHHCPIYSVSCILYLLQ